MSRRIFDLTIITTLLLTGIFCLWRGLSPAADTSTAQQPKLTQVAYSPSVPEALASVTQQRIETIRVGQRMWIGENPSEERDLRVGTDIVDPGQWRKMVLRCPKRDGSTAQVEMLRPLRWLQQRNVQAGGHVDIDVPECGIEGMAEVLDVQACPPVSGGQGRVVTATFHHQAAQTIDITIAGESEPIGSTPNHPIWSETEQEFVRADALSPGEEVRTANSTALVTSIAARGPPEPVYNLEVQFEHVYRVGDSGVLVHNARPCNLTPDGAGRSGAFREAKRNSGIPTSQQPDRVLPNFDRRGNVQPGKRYEYDIKDANGGVLDTKVIRDDAGGHFFGPGDPQNRGPHFNDIFGGHYDY